MYNLHYINLAADDIQRRRNGRAAIYQPRYFPQLHYFNRMVNSDIFVFLDSAQYTKSLIQSNGKSKVRHKSYQSDTPIKFPTGVKFLTVPIRHEGLQSINDIKIDYSQKWINKHLHDLKIAYKRSSYYDVVFPAIKELLSQTYSSLAALNIAVTIWLLSYILGYTLKINQCNVKSINFVLENKNNIRLKKIFKSSEIRVERPEGFRKGTEWTTAICYSLGATEYLHGGTAQSGYMDLEYYKEKGITPVLQNWQGKEYSQQFSKKLGFISNLSMLDLLFNVSQREAGKIIGVS